MKKNRPPGEKWQRTSHDAPTLKDVWAGRRFREDIEPPDLLDAAYAYTVDQEQHADGEIDGSRAWHGWAVRKAFIAGAVWERLKQHAKGRNDRE
jgi:hypothetical protein